MPTEDLENVKKEAFRVCQEFLGDIWCELSISQFKFSTINDGLSNANYRCALPENVAVKNPKTPRQVLLRIYGQQQQSQNVVVSEVATFLLLAERKLGPKLYGVFPNGRLEEFIPSRTLLSKDFKVMYPAIAREMAKIHSIDVPIRKIPDFWPVSVKRWLNELKTYAKSNEKSTFEYLDFYTEETDWVIEEMKKSNSPVVYCHNDLAGGNILFREDSPSEKDPRITFIDIEFGGYNYRGYDIAMHFGEWCFDYCTEKYPYFEYSAENFPTEDEQISYIRFYLQELVKEGIIPSTSVEDEIKIILKEVEFFITAVNLLWSIWFRKMSLREGDSNFGYNAYSEIRLNDYRNFKKKYLLH